MEDPLACLGSVCKRDGEEVCYNQCIYLPLSLPHIKSVPSVCQSVCWHSHRWTVGPRDQKFGIGINLDYILDEFDGKGHRSRSPGWKTWVSDGITLSLHPALLTGVIVLTLSVCGFKFTTLTAERTDIRTWISACRSSVRISRSST